MRGVTRGSGEPGVSGVPGVTEGELASGERRAKSGEGGRSRRVPGVTGVRGVTAKKSLCAESFLS